MLGSIRLSQRKSIQFRFTACHRASVLLLLSENTDHRHFPWQHRHADTTWADLVRDDYSTFHVADYDPDTGDLVDRGGPLLCVTHRTNVATYAVRCCFDV